MSVGRLLCRLRLLISFARRPASVPRLAPSKPDKPRGHRSPTSHSAPNCLRNCCCRASLSALIPSVLVIMSIRLTVLAALMSLMVVIGAAANKKNKLIGGVSLFSSALQPLCVIINIPAVLHRSESDSLRPQCSILRGQGALRLLHF